MSWTDPDIRNHVLEEDSLNVSVYMDKFIITNGSTKATTDGKFKKVKNHGYSTIILYHPSIHKLEDVMSTYQNRFKEEDKNVNLKQKPMLKAYVEYRRVEFYQMLLLFNSYWSAIDFENYTDYRSLKYPNNNILTQMFSNIMTAKNNPRVTAVDKEENIQDLSDIISNSVDANYTIAQFISEKTYLKIKDIEKVYELPVVSTYLSKDLNNYYNGIDEADDSALSNSLSKILGLIDTYKQTTDAS